MEHHDESPMTEDELFQVQKDKIRKRLLKYTRKAFRMLPQMEKPRILDIGCGSGIPTIELARLSNGEITGIDIDQSALDKFKREIEKEQLSTRVQAECCSIFEMDFPDESFDIIWSEGSIYPLGFEKGLREWKRFLKPDGYMVIHDEKGNISKKLEQISSCGYEIMDYFILNNETWWTEFFAPLEQLIIKYRTRQTNDPKMLEEFNQAQRELDTFKKYPEHNTSVFFIIKKK